MGAFTCNFWTEKWVLPKTIRELLLGFKVRGMDNRRKKV